MQNPSTPAVTPFTNHLTKIHGVNVQCSDNTKEVIRTYSRKDFYKVCLYTGECIIEYADRGFKTSGTVLFFGTPHIPYSWEDVNKIKAYSALFTEEFLKTNNNSESLQQSPLFKIGGNPIVQIPESKKNDLIEIFNKMVTAYGTDYLYKDDLIRNYINLIIHEALQMLPAESYNKPRKASERVTSLFMELLERQFPVETPQNPLKLRSARDFADNLSVHINHLNHAVKEVTGRPTSAHIAERIITEAKALLKHTDWSIAEVGYALGFDYSTYFNNYFKRLTGTTPSAFRG